MTQVRIDTMFGGSSEGPSNDDLAIAALVSESSSVKIEEELYREREAEQVGETFVKNGSRDRWGRERKNVGGRPKKRSREFAEEAEIAGDKRSSGSNRKRPGCRSRKEFSARERIEMCKKIRALQKEAAQQFPDKSEKFIHVKASRAIRNAFPHFKRTTEIKKFLNSEQFSYQVVLENRLGGDLTNPQRTSRGAQKSSQVVGRHGHHPGAGFRARGGGRKNKFEKIWSRVKCWHTCQRLMGVRTDTQDVWLQVEDQLGLEIEVLKFLNNRKVLEAPQIVWLAEVEDRLSKLRENRKYREVYVNRLMAWGGMSVGRPSRRSSMTLSQEKLGWQVTMNSFDRAVWLAAHGSSEELKGHVAVPKDFINRRSQIAIIMTDQVPVWVARLSQRTVFAGHEKVQNSKQSKNLVGEEDQAGRIRRTADAQWSQKLPEQVKELAEIQAKEGMTQTRSGGGDQGDEKFRITLELRHAILKFFEGPEVKPVYHELPPILCTYGVHARLSNISMDGKWIEDEEFHVGGEVVVHRAGSSVGNIMEQWRKLRAADPGIFEEIVVMQQPAATFDEVLVAWDLEDLGKRFPAAVLQRDLLSGALSTRAKMAAQLMHQVLCWISPGMTPVAQVTDTDFSYIFKRELEVAKLELIKKIKEQCTKAGTKFKMRFGPAEILFVIGTAVRKLKERAEAQQLGLVALRRNGQLMGGPLGGQIVELTPEQFPWVGEKAFQQVGGHRYPRSWLETRFDHLVDGVPKEVQWQEVLEAHEKGESEKDEKKFAEELPQEVQETIMDRLGKINFDCSGEQFAVEHEVKVCGENVKIPVLRVDIEDVEGLEGLISAEHLKELQKTPEQRRAEKVEGRDINDRHDAREVTRARKALGRGVRLKCALGKFNKEVQEQIDNQLLKYTRHEVLKQIQFFAGRSKTKTPTFEVKKVTPLKAKSPAEIAKKLKAMEVKKKLKGKIILADRVGKSIPAKKVETPPEVLPAKVHGSTKRDHCSWSCSCSCSLSCSCSWSCPCSCSCSCSCSWSWEGSCCRGRLGGFYYSVGFINL